MVFVLHYHTKPTLSSCFGLACLLNYLNRTLTCGYLCATWLCRDATIITFENTVIPLEQTRIKINMYA